MAPIVSYVKNGFEGLVPYPALHHLHLGIFFGVLLNVLSHILCLPTHPTPSVHGNRTTVVQVSWRRTLAVSLEVSPLNSLPQSIS